MVETEYHLTRPEDLKELLKVRLQVLRMTKGEFLAAELKEADETTTFHLTELPSDEILPALCAEKIHQLRITREQLRALISDPLMEA
ncbi:MAG: hypothetical protein U0Z53_26880 [Blastocatellia bacterium]